MSGPGAREWAVLPRWWGPLRSKAPPHCPQGAPAGDERRSLLLDGVEEVLEFSPQWLLLADVDLLRVVLQRDLVQIERVQRPERARTDGDGLLRVVDLDEILEAREGELPDLH